jgi:hypothetical protein
LKSPAPDGSLYNLSSASARLSLQMRMQMSNLTQESGFKLSIFATPPGFECGLPSSFSLFCVQWECKYQVKLKSLDSSYQPSPRHPARLSPFKFQSILSSCSTKYPSFLYQI